MLKLVAIPAWLFAALSAAASAPNQVLLRNIDVGDNGTAQAIATDNSGDLFIVASAADEAGAQHTRITKTDPKGTRLAVYDIPAEGANVGVSPAVVATDAQGNLILAGSYGAASPFPLVKPLFPSITYGGFVMKLSPQLDTVLFSTFLDGYVNAAAVDPAGDVYLAGWTQSAAFPVTPGAFQTTPTIFEGPPLHGTIYAFLMEISPKGDSLLYSTYFGGGRTTCPGYCDPSVGYGVAQTQAFALAVGPSGDVAMAGWTNAIDMPTTPGVLSPTCDCSVNRTYGFLAVFAPGAPLKLSWSTFVGVSGIATLAFDPAGDPVFGGAAWPQAAAPNAVSGVVGKVAKTGAALSWSMPIGGGPAGSSMASLGVAGVAVDAQSQVVLTGNAGVSQTPQLSGTPALGPSYVARLSSDGTTIGELFTGPLNSAGTAVVLTPMGSFISLGSSGTLWMETVASGPSLLAIANAAGGPLTGQVAPDEIVSLFGIGIGPQTALTGQPQPYLYPSSLGGYQVLFNGVAAPLLYAGPTQINAVAPYEIIGQDYSAVQLVTPAGMIDGPVLAVRPAEPSIFADSVTGACAALNQDGTLNSAANPTKAGSVVTMFASGAAVYGGTDGALAHAPQAYGSALPVSVLSLFSPTTLGGSSSLEILFAGQPVETVTGLMQVNFRLPNPLPSGSKFYIALQVGGAVSSPAWISLTQ